MKTTELKAYNRPATGKRANKAVRAEGKVPGVIYDNSAAKHISLDQKEIRSIIYTPETYIVKLNVDGEQYDTIVRDVDFHPVKEHVQHIDFLRISDEKPIHVVLPINLVGTPKGVMTGGKLVIKKRQLTVLGIPSQLPDKVDVDVTALELGSTIKVSDVDFGELKVAKKSTGAIASVEIPRSLRSEMDSADTSTEAVEEEA